MLMVGCIYILDILLDVTFSLISDKISCTLSKSFNLLFRLLFAWIHSWHHLHSKIMSDPSSDSFLFQWKLDLIWCTSTHGLLSHLSHKQISHNILRLVLCHILIWFNITKKSFSKKKRFYLGSTTLSIV